MNLFGDCQKLSKTDCMNMSKESLGTVGTPDIGVLLIFEKIQFNKLNTTSKIQK